MFNFASILAMVEEAPEVLSAAGVILTDVKALMKSPDVLALEAQFAKLFTVVTTPGSAAVVEPVTAAAAAK